MGNSRHTLGIKSFLVLVLLLCGFGISYSQPIQFPQITVTSPPASPIVFNVGGGEQCGTPVSIGSITERLTWFISISQSSGNSVSLPTGDGNTNIAWTLNSCSQRYLCVSDSLNSTSISYPTPVAPGYSLYTFASPAIPAGSSVPYISVTNTAYVKGAALLASRIKVNGVIYVLTIYSINGGIGTYYTYSYYWYYNPNTGVSWTPGDINGTSGSPLQQFGDGIYSSNDYVGFGGCINCSNPNTYLTVYYNNAPTSQTTYLRGSLDAVNWFILDYSTTTTQEMRHIVNKPISYVKVCVTSASNKTYTSYELGIGGL